MKKGYYKLRGTKGEFWFVLVAPNHETIGKSQMYKTLQAARKGIASCQINSQISARFERLLSKIFEPYFNLNAANGENILTSEMYTNTGARDAGVRAVILYGDTTEVIDATTKNAA